MRAPVIAAMCAHAHSRALLAPMPTTVPETVPVPVPIARCSHVQSSFKCLACAKSSKGAILLSLSLSPHVALCLFLQLSARLRSWRAWDQ
eukprot:7783667-Alexandrium_andersonii.AAC.1